MYYYLEASISSKITFAIDIMQPSKDNYERNPSTGIQETIDWVSGPNGQFCKSISEVVMSNKGESLLSAM